MPLDEPLRDDVQGQEQEDEQRIENRPGQVVGRRVEGDAVPEDQREVLDRDDGGQQINGVGNPSGTLPGRHLRDEIAQDQHPGHEKHREQDRLVAGVSQGSEEEGDQYGRDESPEQGQVLFHREGCFVQR